MHKVSRAALVAAMFAVAGPLSAQVVFDGGTPNAGNGNEMTQWRQANDFTLAAPTTVTGVRFWAFSTGDIASAYSGTIQWDFMSDAGGTPGSVLYSGTATPVGTSYACAGCTYATSEYDFSVGSLAFGSGNFWLDLHNGTGYDRREFYWSQTVPGVGQPGYEQNGGTGGYASNGQDHAFQLIGTQGTTTPEPSSMALIGTGLFGLVPMIRRRRK